MSFTTILGIMVGLGLFIGSIFISTDNYLVFVSLSSALMVIGGTLAATFIAYEARYVLLALKLIFKIYFSSLIAGTYSYSSTVYDTLVIFLDPRGLPPVIFSLPGDFSTIV